MSNCITVIKFQESTELIKSRFESVVEAFGTKELLERTENELKHAKARIETLESSNSDLLITQQFLKSANEDFVVTVERKTMEMEKLNQDLKRQKREIEKLEIQKENLAESNDNFKLQNALLQADLNSCQEKVAAVESVENQLVGIKEMMAKINEKLK
jgi:hypothetical protein